MELKEKLEIPSKDEVEEADEDERKILIQMRKVWEDNEIEKVKAWSNKEYCDEPGHGADYWYRAVEIYEINGERRYYEFNEAGTHPGYGAGCFRYTPKKRGDDWIHSSVGDEDLDDVDRLILGEFSERLGEIEDEKLRIEKEKKERILNKISEAFEDAEKPDPRVEAPDEAEKYREGYEKMEVEGETYEHPDKPRNIYGGGRWWVLQEDEGKIWHVINHGHDGDAWMVNNVATGGAGAIGHRIDWNDKVAEMIRECGDRK